MESRMRIAGIDIGTNTILMLIAEVNNNGGVYPIADYHSIARLGEKVNETGVISKQGLERAIGILAEYKKIVEQYSVDFVACVGTSALREAKNSSDVIQKINNHAGFNVDIIDGELEAYLSFIGTVEDTSYSVVLDIGGGSTEIVAGEQEKIVFRKSINIGAVRFTEKFISSHPPSEDGIEKIKQECRLHFSKISKDLIRGNVYAVAGTPTTIVSVLLGLKEYDKTKVDNYHLTIEEIRKAKEMFVSLSIEDIVTKLYVPRLRADVITAGTLILETFCEHFNLSHLIVSDKGLRYGLVKYYARKLLV
ncbi:MAG: Ppx/GppA family phosphatase [Candidatus Kapaibacteriota bacterium]